MALHVNRLRVTPACLPTRPPYVLPTPVAHPILQLAQYHAKASARSFCVSTLLSREPPYLDIWTPRRAERRKFITECVTNRSYDLFLAPTTTCGALDARPKPCDQGEGGSTGGVCGMDGDGLCVVPGAFQCRTVGRRWFRDHRNRPAVRSGTGAEPRRSCTFIYAVVVSCT